MVSCLYGVYLLSFCLISLNDRSIPNLCSITSLGTPGISDIFHVKNIEIFLEKSEEHKFLFGVKLRANLELLRIVGVSQNLLDVLILH
jgi:hypothetical protein